MNKKLLVLICSIILFQYVYNSDCTSVSSPTSESNCEGVATSSETKKCVFDSDSSTKRCKEVDIPCSEKTSVSERNKDICLKLVASEGKKCLYEGGNCVEKIKKIQKTSSTNNLKFSLAFLIVLFLF